MDWWVDRGTFGKECSSQDLHNIPKGNQEARLSNIDQAKDQILVFRILEHIARTTGHCILYKYCIS